MPDYDRSLRPPAPVAMVVVAHPTTGAASGPVRGKLDTGADITVVPEALVAALGLRPKAHVVWVRNFDGSHSQRLAYCVALHLEGVALSAVRCVAARRRNVLLGRNVLNHFLVTLNGKDLTFTVIDP